MCFSVLSLFASILDSEFFFMPMKFNRQNIHSHAMNALNALNLTVW